MVVGGTENRESLKDVETIDMSSNTWSTWTSQLNIGREGPGVIQIENELYVVGGRGIDVKGSVEIWNSESGWFICPDLHVKHQNQEYSVALLESPE